jgi:predicted ABC-type ATPase
MSTQFVAPCTILGGTNGSGKSTIYEEAVRLQIEGEFVNADVLARQMSPSAPESAGLKAGKRVIQRLGEVIALRNSFVHETTPSSHQSLQIMRKARAVGYHVGLIFVVLHNVDLNVLRVRERVKMGGHSIPEKDIRRRYDRALANLPEAIKFAHQTAIYDNSSVSHVKLIEISDGRIAFNGLDESNPTHCAIAGAVGSGLDIAPDAVFRSQRRRKNCRSGERLTELNPLRWPAIRCNMSANRDCNWRNDGCSR